MTTNRPYTDDDLRTEAARQLSAHRGHQHPNATLAAMLDAHIESTRTDTGDDGLTWDEALECRDLNTPATAIHTLIEGAADISEWAINLGADGLIPDAEHVDITHADVTGVRIHFAFHPGMPEELRASVIAAVHEDTAPDEADDEEEDEPVDSDSDVFDLISDIASRLRDATDSGEYHAVGLIYDLAMSRTTVAEARAELADIEFGHA
ncbi:hypothetical protein G9272_32245 [Streptomyces asoensis]|uniref:Uncharacterized protein n=1 Tax=Streptomyces asoensis TaxID=249586 RepID=A0A6M4WV38_9ACTN|nr:hypothetical protein [Streptomyces asoensis]QJT04390.1 hypothetical protein G9272_32245 [Streptomyces asoensis]